MKNDLMKESDIIDGLVKDIKKSSIASLVMMAIGIVILLGSFFYGASQVVPLERKIADLSGQVAKETEKLDELQLLLNKKQGELEGQTIELNKIMEQKNKIIKEMESLNYSSANENGEVYQIKATAMATGRFIKPRRDGVNDIPQNIKNLPEYLFRIYIEGSPSFLEEIESVEYVFMHPSFNDPVHIVRDPNKRFMYSYKGWGCLSAVSVTVSFKSSLRRRFEFDMCRSLGAGW